MRNRKGVERYDQNQKSNLAKLKTFFKFDAENQLFFSESGSFYNPIVDPVPRRDCGIRSFAVPVLEPDCKVWFFGFGFQARLRDPVPKP